MVAILDPWKLFSSQLEALRENSITGITPKGCGCETKGCGCGCGNGHTNGSGCGGGCGHGGNAQHAGNGQHAGSHMHEGHGNGGGNGGGNGNGHQGNGCGCCCCCCCEPEGLGEEGLVGLPPEQGQSYDWQSGASPQPGSSGLAGSFTAVNPPASHVPSPELPEMTDPDLLDASGLGTMNAMTRRRRVNIDFA